MNREARELKAFLDAIAADPRNMDTRLVFADWLDEHDEPEAARQQREFSVERYDAEQWLRLYAQRFNSYDDTETAFRNLIEGLRSKQLFAHGSDLHGLYELDDADELKRNAEIYLRESLDDWNGFTFSCSC